MARDSGQRPPTPVRVIKPDLSDSESEKEKEVGEKEADEGKPAAKARKKRKSAAAEYYDVHDPFIDDSELALDERTYFAQTKQQGFYVSSGEVALLKDKTPRKPKPKSRKSNANPDVPSISAAGPSALGTKDSPIALGEDGEDQDGNDEDEGGKVGQKRKRYSTVWENGKKRRVVNQNDFHPDVQQAVEELKLARDKEDWNTKGKFPPGIKPLLAQVSLKAVELDEYDEHFFNLMATLFPYNKFTITKLIKRTIFQDHVNLLNQRQAVLLEQLAAVTKEGFARAQEEHEKTVAQWETRQAKLKEAGESAFGAPGLVAPTTSISARQSTDAEEADGMDVDAPPASQMENGAASAMGGLSAAGKGDKGEPHPPSKKYRMTDQIKTIVWQLVTLSNECCRLENEKNLLEGTPTQVSEQGLRKNLYQKIVAAFPEGWMSSGQISRDVSAMKKKLEKEAMDNEA
ncbi:hypothetical protein FIBSPDRAFT_847657 [Athelia psychrophila]|uniref:Ubinuclein middle domain-containing protein n=1 Tax=Athelia psychrophila TaxID=1759441 RepID=A0A166VTN8_9AGAM|nr:hypothetical protein FIBSPDRAFT_847657 [Fibularhizoctonia sp. CBS 109695]